MNCIRKALIGICLLLFPITALLGDVFPFSNDGIDVVIPCVEKDLEVLNLCIRGIRQNGVQIRRIIVVSKDRLTNRAEWFPEANYPFTIRDVAISLANGNPKSEKILLGKNSRVGWYYQQLLKLYAPLVIPDLSSNVLILDADAIFLRPVSFLSETGGGLYNPGFEYHFPYFIHAAQLLPGLKKIFPQYSGISHHMIFQRPVIESLFSEVENLHGLPFWRVFCQLVDPSMIPYSGASEYEIYFNYVFSRTDQVSLRMLKWANIQKMSEIELYRARGMDYVCLHAYEREP